MSKLSPDLSSVTTIGLDLAKHVFQVHCIDAEGRVLLARSLRRAQLLSFFASLPPCRPRAQSRSCARFGSESRCASRRAAPTAG